MTGKEAYEEDVRRHPLHDDNSPRPSWDQLPDYAQWSWNRKPTPREWKTARNLAPVSFR